MGPFERRGLQMAIVGSASSQLDKRTRDRQCVRFAPWRVLLDGAAGGVESDPVRVRVVVWWDSVDVVDEKGASATQESLGGSSGIRR